MALSARQRIKAEQLTPTELKLAHKRKRGLRPIAWVVVRVDIQERPIQVALVKSRKAADAWHHQWDHDGGSVYVPVMRYGRAVDVTGTTADAEAEAEDYVAE